MTSVECGNYWYALRFVTGRVAAEDMSGPYDGHGRLPASGLGHQLVPGLLLAASSAPASSAAAAAAGVSSVAGRGSEPSLAVTERPRLPSGSHSNTGSSSAVFYDVQQHQQQQQQQQQQHHHQQQQHQHQLQQQQHPHQSQCGPAIAYPTTFPAVPPYIKQQSAMQFCFTPNPDKPTLSKTFSLPHEYESKTLPLGYRPIATAADVAFGAVFPNATVARKTDVISCPNLGRRQEPTYRKDKMATSEETQSLLSELVSEEDSSYSLFDITGPSGQGGQARFPWQRDAGVQCDLGPRVQSAFWPVSGALGGTSLEDGGSGLGPGPVRQPETCIVSTTRCVLDTMKRSSLSMQEGLCLEVPQFPGLEGVSVSTPALHHQDPWASMEQLPNKGDLTSAHGTECRLFCSLHNQEKTYRCPDKPEQKKPTDGGTRTLLRPTNLG